MSRFTNLTKVALTLGAVATLFSACSQKESSSLGPVSPAPLNNGSTRNFTASSVEISGRVTTIDAVARTMQITGQAATIQVATQAEVVLKTNGNETPITLADILPGDSVDVRGDFQGASTFVADRVRKRQNDNANEIEFGGRVVTIDAGARTMTVTGHGELITVAANAEVVSRAQGMEVAISLADINSGDSVEIRGVAQAGGILADRVRLRVQHVEDGIDSEVEFTAAILSIDYAAGTFMVSGHSETITTDSATIIFGRTHDRGVESAASDSSDDDNTGRTPIEFANLKAGDVVEVHANRTSASTLYAVAIEVEDGAFEDELEIEFKDIIASIDVANRTVTFQNSTLTGMIAVSADLRGLNNETITLADFAVGQIVEVKGFEMSAGTIEVTRMEKDNSL